MTREAEVELRRLSVHLQALAEIRAVTVTDGPTASGRLLEGRTPSGLPFDVALDRGGDVLCMPFRGQELGWHSAVDAQTPRPSVDAEHGMGFMRGFDGLLVTCGLDHHGVTTRTPADQLRYPLRRTNVHWLHGRIRSAKAEVLEKRLDWAAGIARIRLFLRQATVFEEVLEFGREIVASLTAPWISLQGSVTNRGFRPIWHRLLYNVNCGWPLLDEVTRLMGHSWALASALDHSPAVPTDDHMEEVDAAPSPVSGRVGFRNDSLGLVLGLDSDPERLPVTALWRAFQSGTYALGLKPQTRLDEDEATQIFPGEARSYAFRLTLEDVRREAGAIPAEA